MKSTKKIFRNQKKLSAEVTWDCARWTNCILIYNDLMSASFMLLWRIDSALVSCYFKKLTHKIERMWRLCCWTVARNFWYNFDVVIISFWTIIGYQALNEFLYKIITQLFALDGIWLVRPPNCREKKLKQ